MTKKLSGYLKDIEKATDKYYGCVDKAKEAVNELENMPELNDADLDPDVRAAINEQIVDIRQKSADTDFDQYKVAENDQRTEEYLSKLDSLSGLYDTTGDK